MSQLNPQKTHHILYDIPSHLIGMPGSQADYPVADLDITPGTTQPFNLIFSTSDGVPLNLQPFSVNLVFWTKQSFDIEGKPDLMNYDAIADIVLKKKLQIDDPYDKSHLVVLDGEETELLGIRAKSTGVSWGIFLKNDNNQVFMCEVGPSGQKQGTVVVRTSNNLPKGIIDQI